MFRQQFWVVCVQYGGKLRSPVCILGGKETSDVGLRSPVYCPLLWTNHPANCNRVRDEGMRAHCPDDPVSALLPDNSSVLGCGLVTWQAHVATWQETVWNHDRQKVAPWPFICCAIGWLEFWKSDGDTIKRKVSVVVYVQGVPKSRDTTSCWRCTPVGWEAAPLVSCLWRRQVSASKHETGDLIVSWLHTWKAVGSAKDSVVVLLL
jgi:hypothetical protein